MFLEFLFFVGFIVLLLIITRKQIIKDKYDGYDYDQENPNALIRGNVIGGTVYASYPNQTGGLGWIL